MMIDDISGPFFKESEKKLPNVGAAPSILIVEGIDNIGKGTFIDYYIKNLGFHQIIKYDKPRETIGSTLKEYQRKSFRHGFDLISSSVAKSDLSLIFDRFHLGEVVYSPLYRGYSGDYVMSLEEEFTKKMNGSLKARVCLLLLTTRDFTIIEDDGKSFDPKKKELEQKLFIDTFERSTLPKIRINVDSDEEIDPESELSEPITWKSSEEIFNEFMEEYRKLLS